MAEAQEDGYYPRINAAHVAAGTFVNKIVSLVGSVQSFDGTTVQFQCADGGSVRVTVENAPEPFAFPPGTMLEIVGFCDPAGHVSLFVTRELTSDLDLNVYNRMITEVQMNPKFAQYFEPSKTTTTTTTAMMQ